MSDRIEDFLEQLNAYIELNNISLPDSFKSKLIASNPSERVRLLQARGIFNLPYSKKALAVQAIISN